MASDVVVNLKLNVRDFDLLREAVEDSYALTQDKIKTSDDPKEKSNLRGKLVQLGDLMEHLGRR